MGRDEVDGSMGRERFWEFVNKVTELGELCCELVTNDEWPGN